MRSPAGGGSLRHEFLRRWLKGLQIYSNGRNKKEMSILERKKVIKLSADVAMASTRVGTTCWSRALIAKVSKKYSTNNNNNNKILLEHINNLMKKKKTTSSKDEKNKKKKLVASMPIIRSKKILRKSCNTAHRRYLIKKREGGNINKSDVGLITGSSINVAKNLVKKRTQLLKSLVPGGELMDEVSLIRETLDYIVSLRLQVQVMRHLANATVQLENQQK